MKQHQDFLRALDDHGWSRSSADRQHARKTSQFCRQVQRALNLALGDAPPAGISGELYVEQVTAAPDCGHLVVHVIVPGGCGVREALQALARDVPRLRTEVAAAISRKRAPELTFVPAIAEGGPDD